MFKPNIYTEHPRARNQNFIRLNLFTTYSFGR